MEALVLRLRRRWRKGDGSELRAWGDAVCPGGAKALLCGAPDFGGFTGKSTLRGGLPFRRGRQARRGAGRVEASCVCRGWNAPSSW